ncbi:MAG: tetratricopeptide repeat protein [Planctomycetia bacterium]|nr:tetratricopeptide repeat protein [Planctomycetia bacterium]
MLNKMLQLFPLILTTLCLVTASEQLLADDDKKPTPESASSTPNTPRDPNLNPAHDQARNDSDQAHRRGDHKKAIELATSVLTENPNDHVAYYLRASARVELGIANREAALLRQGIADAREAIRLKPADNLNYFLPYLYGMTNLASLENKKAHAEVAVKIADQLISQPTLKGEDRANALYQRALAHSAVQDNLKAVQDYQAAVKISSQHLGARIGLADTLAAIGQNDAALTAYDETVKSFPNMALVHNNRGMFQQAQGRFGEAVVDFTKALELDPQFLVALTNRGFTLMNMGQFEEAENDFSESLKINAAQPMVISLRAGSKLSRGDLDGAIKDYNEVLKWDSKNAVGQAELGFALFFANKMPEALAAFDKAHELDPNLRFMIPWRYLTMLHLNQKAQADTKLAADIALPAAKRQWGDALLIYLADKQSEVDLRKAINTTDPRAADPQTCEAEFFVGQRKLLAGQKDVAKAHFEAALKSKSTQLSAYRGAKWALKK